MSIGAGITMIVLGLIFMTGVIEVDIPGINESALGAILLIGGIVAIVLTYTVWGNRGRTTRVVQSAPPTDRVVERRVVERDVQDPNVL
jgi:hypothetical protein